MTRLVLADEDAYYLSHLIMKFAAGFGSELDLQVLTDRAYAEAYFETAEEPDLLLISEELRETAGSFAEPGRVLVLTEDEAQGKTEGYIYKYMSVQQIFEETAGRLRCFEAPAGAAPGIITFYSHRNCREKSILAAEAAALFEESGRSVLFLNAAYLQDLSAVSEKIIPIEAEQVLALSAVDYVHVKPLIRRSRFDYLPAFAGGILSCRIPFACFQAIAADAVRSGDYDLVIIDQESGLSREGLELFSESGMVLFFGRDNEEEKAEMNRIMKRLGDGDSDKYMQVFCKERSELKRQSQMIVRLFGGER